ncbi:MAG: IS110 family transposase [Bifidobacteriaceae bacterium]|jgi:hypothetical protein|nr:IS110 family transposase [Bifidobacteriaceae bacterium]
MPVVEEDVLHARCAGLDISKRDAKCCVRVLPEGAKRPRLEHTTWGVSVAEVDKLRRHLEEADVTCVVMEATSTYWKPFVRHEAHCSIPRAAGADSGGGWWV